jgi:photosystem II stability/assembly factor-like uncharacterized protein
VLNDVAALDTRRAVAVGQEARGFPDPPPPGPAALYTDDGGMSWRRAALPSFDGDQVADIELRSTCVTVNGFGLATGVDFGPSAGASLVLATRDAGKSWVDVTARLPRRFAAVTACGPDGRLWFLAEDSTVRMSDDGGETWKDLHGNLPPALRVRRGVFVQHGAGWIATSRGVGDSELGVFVTTNDGATWVSRFEAEGLGELVMVGFDAIDDRQAVVVTQEARALGLPPASVARSWATLDGGATWTLTLHPETIDFLSDVDLVP